MSESLMVLGQVVPSPTTLTALYTVPAATMTSVSSLFICNQNGGLVANIRISLAIGGAADAPAQYLYYALPVNPLDTFVATVGLSLASGDIIRCYSDQSNVSFNLTGVQVQ